MQYLSRFFGDKKYRYAVAAKFSAAFNMLVAAGKLAVGIFTGAHFWIASVLYNVMLGLCRGMSVRVHDKYFAAGNPSRDAVSKAEGTFYAVGVLLFAAGVLFGVYCGKTYFSPLSYKVDEILGITIAAVTFTEIALSSIGLKNMRRENELMLEAVKITSLASSLGSLIVVQAALMSLSDGNSAPWVNTTSILLTAPAAVLGLYMAFRMHFVRNGINAKLTARRAARLRRKYECNAELLGFDDDYAYPLLLRVRCEDTEADRRFIRACVRKLRVNVEKM